MRVLLGTSFLNGMTGSELLLFDLARGLQRRGHEVRVWVKELVPDAPLPKLLRVRRISISPDLPGEREVDAVIFQLKETFETWRDSYRGVPRLAVCHGPKLPREIAPADLPEVTHLALTREAHRYRTVGDGMVTPDRLDAVAAVNFSGRARGHDFTWQSMRAELARYTPEMGRTNRVYASRHYDLDRFVGQVEKLLTATAPSRHCDILARCPVIREPSG